MIYRYAGEVDRAADHFIRFLVDGRREITSTEVEARKKSLGLTWLKGPFAVAQVATDYTAVPHGEKDAALRAYEECVARQLRDLPTACYVFTNSYNNIIVLLAFDGKPMTAEALNACFIRLHERLISRFDMEVFIGIGHIVDTYKEIADSCSNAMEMLGFKYQYADRGVINTATIVQFQYNMSLGNGIELDRVTGCFRDGNLGKMEIRLNELAETVRRRPHVSGTSIRRSLVEATVNILHIASNAGVDVEQALENIDPYRWIMRQNHTEVIIDWIMKLSARLLTQIQAKRETEKKDVIRQAMQYVEENLSDPALGLQQVSGAVGLSDTYFSQLFKKEAGSGISTYITHKRVDRARTLLRDTRLTGVEIARQVGFRSAGYFGQVFRKVTGVTPQAYRRITPKE